MNPIEQYIHDRDEQVRANLTNRDLAIDTYRMTESLVKTNYVKNFTYMGTPILQYPTDLMVMQELIWEVKPTVIIEIGIAFGGMLAFYASVLNITSSGKVIGIDKEIREHNRLRIESHPVFRGEDNYNTILQLIEGSSITDEVFNNIVYSLPRDPRVLISLDSDHTHDHVLQELKLYSPLVSVGSYIVVFDTAIEFYHQHDKNQNRAWSKGNNPWTATQEFLKSEMGKNFIIDKGVEKRALITSAPEGWLRRIR